MGMNTMLGKLIFCLSMLAAAPLSQGAPQSRIIEQDVGAPEEYLDSAGRGGDEWWRNYEIVEDHINVNELDDHLEMLYMYSVNPLELTTIRSLPRSTTPRPQPALSSVDSAPQFQQSFAHRRPSTFATSPPTEAPLSRPSSFPEPQQPTQARFGGQISRGSPINNPLQAASKPPQSSRGSSFPNPAASESQLFPSRHPSTFLTTTQPPPITSAVSELTSPFLPSQPAVERSRGTARSKKPVGFKPPQAETGLHPNLPLESPVDVLHDQPSSLPQIQNVAHTTEALPDLQSNPSLAPFSSERRVVPQFQAVEQIDDGRLVHQNNQFNNPSTVHSSSTVGAFVNRGSSFSTAAGFSRQDPSTFQASSNIQDFGSHGPQSPTTVAAFGNQNGHDASAADTFGNHHPSSIHVSSAAQSSGSRGLPSSTTAAAFGRQNPASFHGSSTADAFRNQESSTIQASSAAQDFRNHGSRSSTTAAAFGRQNPSNVHGSSVASTFGSHGSPSSTTAGAFGRQNPSTAQGSLTPDAFGNQEPSTIFASSASRDLRNHGSQSSTNAAAFVRQNPSSLHESSAVNTFGSHESPSFTTAGAFGRQNPSIANGFSTSDAFGNQEPSTLHASSAAQDFSSDGSRQSSTTAAAFGRQNPSIAHGSSTADAFGSHPPSSIPVTSSTVGAFGSQNSGVTFKNQQPVTPAQPAPANPFLAPASIPVVQQRYSRLLNRYSLLDQVESEAPGPKVQTEVHDLNAETGESNRLIRQPTPVIHAPFAPSSRNFLNQSSEAPVAPSRRPKRRRLKTTTTLPTTEPDTQLSDSEEVLFSQPQPQLTRRIRPTQGRFIPSTVQTVETTLLPTTIPPLQLNLQAEPLSIQAPASRPIFSGARRRTKRPLQEAEPLALITVETSTTATSPPATTRSVIASGRSRSRNARPLATASTTTESSVELAPKSVELIEPTSSPFSPVKSSRFVKTRPSFFQTTSTPISGFSAETHSPLSDGELSTESHRTRFGATPNQRRTFPEAATSPTPVAVESRATTPQLDNRVRRLNPRTSGLRFNTSPVTVTAPTTTISPPVVTSDVVTENVATPTVPLQGSSKFKPRGSSLRRGLNTISTTSQPATTTTTTTAISSSEASRRPEIGAGSRFQPRPSKFRAFQTGTTTASSSNTLGTTEILTSTEVTSTLATTKPRKFQPRNSFPRFQDSPKRAPFGTTTTTVQPATEPSTTARTTSSKLFKSRTPFSRFSPGAGKTVTLSIESSTESILTSLPVEITQPVFTADVPTSPRTPQRPLFKTRTAGQVPLRSAGVVSSTLPPVSNAVPTNVGLVAATTSADVQAQTPFNSKRRRRPVSKKSFAQTEADMTSPTSVSAEPVFIPTARSQPEFVSVNVAPTTPPLLLSPSGVHFSEAFQAAAIPQVVVKVPKRRKVRRRKITQRSTQSFSDEQAAASQITKVIVNFTTVGTTAVTENATEASTTVPIVATGKGLKESFALNDKAVLLELKAGDSSKNSKNKLALESLNAEEPLTAEADESGDDSGIWFSDSAGIGADAGSFHGGNSGGSNLDKLFRIEHVANPPVAQIRRNSDEGDPKSWFGLADEGVPKADESASELGADVLNGTGSTESHSEVDQSGHTDFGHTDVGQTDVGQHDVVQISESASQDGTNSKENKTATFSVSSSTSIHTEVSKSRSSQPGPEITDAKEQNLKSEDLSPKIIIIDKASLKSDDNAERESTTEHVIEEAGENAKEEQDSTTSTTTATTTTEEASTVVTRTTENEGKKDSGRSRAGEDRTSTTARARDRNSRVSSRDSASRNRASSGASRRDSSTESSVRGRSGASRSRDRTAATSTTATTTEELETTMGATEDVSITEKAEGPKKRPSDEVGYFGEDEVAPSSHGALDGPVEKDGESGPTEADPETEKNVDGEVATVDVSEHNDQTSGGHVSETAADDESSRWELSPLTDLGGPTLRESSSFNVEVRSRAPKLLQLASRRETKSSRSDLSDEFSNKRGAQSKIRNFLKIIGMNAAAFRAAELATEDDNSTDINTSTKRVRVIPLKSFSYPAPPIKTPEDIAELFETITSAPSGASRPFQPPSKAAILRLNVTSVAGNSTAEEDVGTESPSTDLQAPFKILTLNGPANCSRSDRNICPASEEYPRNLVDLVVKQHEASLKRMWQELEANRTLSELFPDDPARKSEELSVCDSSIEALQPGWARDATTGKWMIVVNTPEYPQVIRVESCLRLKKECLFISPYYKSSCVEHYSAHRLVAIRPNDPASGPIVAIFKFPCGCSCKVGMFHGGN